MNTSQGALYFGAGIDTVQWRRDVDSMRRDILGLTQTTVQQTSQMDSAFKNLSIGIASYFSIGAIKSFVTELINVRGEFQKTEIAFSTMLGNADQAKSLMGQMVDLAAKTPFSLQDVSSGAKQLLAFQVPANEVVDTLTRMGNIAAGLGVPLSRINLVYGQVKAKGKLAGDDLRQFTEAGIPMVAELAKKFGKTTAEITEMVSAGKIGFKDVQDVLFGLTNEGGMFFNLMEKQSASLSGQIANLGDSWDQMLNKIGEANDGILSKGIEGLTYLIEHYEKVLEIVESLVVAYGSYKAALIITSAAQALGNRTIQSEIALLGISEKMKLGRAMVTQRQAEATAREAVAELASTRAKYSALQAEVSSLAVKKQSAIQSGINATAKAQEARVQLQAARSELAAIQSTGTARQISIAQKRVESSQNTVIATQESASIARKRALAAATEFNAAKQNLENTAKAIGTAQGAVTVATEAAQTAAKNANTIATARLTLATTLRTAATRLATQAQAILNATMLDNPIVLLIAAAAALTYAYFKLRDTSTALSIAEKQLNDERQRSSKLIEEIKNKTQELTAVINSDTATKLQQLEAYKQMQKIYPDLLGSMDLETFKKLGSVEAQKKLNAELDKFSTQNIRNNIDKAKKSIEEYTAKIDELNKILSKRNGDSGIYLDQLEIAKKNLEAQKINLEKYNNELDQRLENEKLSSMSLAEQKKYWEGQVKSINEQISALEKSNIKKSQAVDKLNNINSLVKTTSIGLINWNINPLLSQLNKAQSEIQKINNAQTGVSVDKNKAFWENQKKAAAEANDAMSAKDMGGAAWNENVRKYREAEEALKKYDYSDRALLKAQKERDRERKLLEKGAEKSFLAGSISRIDQEINLLEEALKRSSGNSVRLRYIDKYGKERNSSEIQSVKEAQDKLLVLRERRAEREKLIEVKSFQEKTDEAERQWNNYYKLAEFYGKATADAQYKDLFKGSQSYLQYLEKEQQALKDKQESGGILSEKDKNNLVFIQDKINSLNGNETPLENFKKGIENAIKTIPSLVDQLDYLEKAQDEAFNKEGSNSNLFLQEKSYLEQKKRDVLQSQKELYSEFIKEQETFESKKTSIEQKYNDIRKNIGENNSYSDAERLRLLGAATKEEGKEISSASLESFQKTELWVKAFGDLDKVGPKTLKKMRNGFKEFLESDKALTLLPEQLKIVQDAYAKLNQESINKDPFAEVSISVEKYTKKRKELDEIEKKSGKSGDAYTAKLEETNSAFVDIIEASGRAAKVMQGYFSSITEAAGVMTDEIKSTINDVEQLVEGVYNTIKGFYGNKGQMITGIIQMVGALTKLLNGDNDRERHIKSWQRSVEDLKFAYQELQYVIEQTAGEDQIAKQREVISNLKEQQKILQQMKSEENAKKKEDQGKIDTYNQQINDINLQIQKLIDDFKTSVTTTNFKDLSENIANALIEAFGKGEDAAASFEKVVDDVMRNAVANALKIKILQPAVESMVDQLYASMGYGSQSGATAEQAKLLQDYKGQIAEIDKRLQNANAIDAATYNALKKDLEERIKVLNQQIASNVVSGSFDGLTEAEREAIKATGENAMQQYMDALKQYEELFGASAENAQGLKGDIKGITEKTAGALEAQFNAVRINIVAILKLVQGNQIVANAQTALLSQIEVNTRRLHNMDKVLTEMNSKIKPGLAGIP